MTRRCTVSSAVSPVGPDLVGTSVAEGERASPQSAHRSASPRREGLCVPRIASPSSVVLSHPPWGRVLSGARLRVTRWSGACQLRVCVRS